MRLRAEVRRFAEEMERTLLRHDEQRGDSWKDERLPWLMERLEEEQRELREAWEWAIACLKSSVKRRVSNKTGGCEEADPQGKDGWDCVAREAVDVANFAMFVHRQARLSAEAAKVEGF